MVKYRLKMGKINVLIYISVLVVILAYILNDPIPDGLEPVWRVKIILGSIKAVNLMSIVAGHLGFEEGPLRRELGIFADSLFTKPTFPSVTTSYLNFSSVPVRVYVPQNKGEKAPDRAVIYYHGGGWVIGSVGIFEASLKDLAGTLNAVVVSVDYRLAPEHVYPAAIDDCEEATEYFLQHAQEYGVDPKRVAVMGDSAGGHMAATVSIQLRNKKFKYRPKLQVLFYPVTQALDLDTPSYRANENGPFLTRYDMAFFFANYLHGSQGHSYIQDFFENNHTTSIIKKSNAKTYMDISGLPKDNFLDDYKPSFKQNNLELWNKIKDKVMDLSFSPLFTPDLSQLPHALISTCQYDVLRDDGIWYANRLRKAGVKVHHVNVPICFHAWFTAAKVIPILDKELDKIVQYMDQNL